MAMRLAQTPSGGARVAYGFLALVWAGIGALLLLAMAWPVLNSVGACSTDDTGLCGLALGLLVWTVGCWLVLAWAVRVLRLGLWFWLLVVALQLVSVQIVLQFVVWWPLVLLLFVPLLAAVVTDPGHARDRIPGWRRWTLMGVGLIALVQFAVWAWITVFSGP